MRSLIFMVLLAFGLIYVLDAWQKDQYSERCEAVGGTAMFGSKPVCVDSKAIKEINRGRHIPSKQIVTG